MARHPWQVTLREFIARARREYGVEIDPAAAAVAGGQYFRQGPRLFPVPVMEPDEVMPLPLLRYLCRLFQIPPEDFGLDAEEKD